MKEYTYPTNTASESQYANDGILAGPEMETDAVLIAKYPDYARQAERQYSVAMLGKLLAEYEAQGIDPPDYQTLYRICDEAAAAWIIEVQS